MVFELMHIDTWSAIIVVDFLPSILRPSEKKNEWQIRLLKNRIFPEFNRNNQNKPRKFSRINIPFPAVAYPPSGLSSSPAPTSAREIFV